jgi:hypothetical protein
MRFCKKGVLASHDLVSRAKEKPQMNTDSHRY